MSYCPLQPGREAGKDKCGEDHGAGGQAIIGETDGESDENSRYAQGSVEDTNLPAGESQAILQKDGKKKIG